VHRESRAILSPQEYHYFFATQRLLRRRALPMALLSDRFLDKPRRAARYAPAAKIACQHGRQWPLCRQLNSASLTTRAPTPTSVVAAIVEWSGRQLRQVSGFAYNPSAQPRLGGLLSAKDSKLEIQAPRKLERVLGGLSETLGRTSSSRENERGIIALKLRMHM